VRHQRRKTGQAIRAVSLSGVISAGSVFSAENRCRAVLLLCFNPLQNGFDPMKYLLLIALFFFVLWLWRKSLAPAREGRRRPLRGLRNAWSSVRIAGLTNRSVKAS
jgi:hypothetical protein